jgi:hypothetical protein
LSPLWIFTGGVGREIGHRESGTLRARAHVVPLGLIAGWGGVAVSLATFGTEWDAKPNVTRVVSRVSGCDGSEGMDVARKAESPKEIQSSDKSEHSIVPIGYLI